MTYNSTCVSKVPGRHREWRFNKWYQQESSNYLLCWANPIKSLWSIRQALSSNLLTQLLGTKVLITQLAIVWHVHPIKSTLHQLNKKRRNWTYSSTIDQLSALKLYNISLHFLHKVKTMFSCDEEPDALWYFSPFIIWDPNRFLLNIHITTGN